MQVIEQSGRWPKGKLRTSMLAAGLVACLLAAGVLREPVRGNQITPLEDVVPLDQLEIRTDDLIRLATSLADGVRELKTAHLSVKTLQTLQPNANVTGLEYQIAQLNVQASESKVKVLRAIAESQLVTAQAKLEFLRRIAASQNTQLRTSDIESNPRVQQAEATVRILRLILEIK
jgi:hypothetical protein